MNNKYLFIAGIVGILFIAGGATVVKTFKKTAPVATPPKQTNIVDTPTVAPSVTSKTSYTLEDVAKHKTAEDCWLVIDKTVYNVTAFIPDHPGGLEIVKGCGQDATMMFQREREHQENDASYYLPEFKIGVLQ